MNIFSQNHDPKYKDMEQNILSGLGGIVLGICCVGIILFILIHFHILHLPTSTSNPSTKQIQAIKPLTPLESCQVNPKEHPLVYKKIIDHNVTTGAYMGYITSLSEVTPQGAFQIGVRSIDGRETHTFTFQNKNILLYNISTKLFIPYNSLIVNKRVTMSFDCNPKNGNIFTIFAIGEL